MLLRRGSRQRVLVTRGVVLVAIAFSFAVSTAVFNTTYNAQSRVDAELTNGADVQVAVFPGKCRALAKENLLHNLQ